MSNEHMQTIEINGIKMEVDMRHAKRIDTFKVGDPVKLLLTQDNRVVAGMIIGFEAFESMPTIVVAYVNAGYYSDTMSYAFVNTKSKDKYEVVACQDDTLMTLDKSSVLRKFGKDIEDSYNKAKELEKQREHFLKMFDVYFPKAASVDA